MKVSELTGYELDYWVGKAEGLGVRMYDGLTITPAFICYDPSDDWSLGGPIIERERIHLFQPTRKEPGCAALIDDDYDWEGGSEGRGDSWWGHGETPLIAAMRAYVRSKFGDEVAQEGKAS